MTWALLLLLVVGTPRVQLTSACALVLLVLTSCATTPRGEYPRNDCRAGGEFTYHSDGSWDATVRSDCGRGW